MKHVETKSPTPIAWQVIIPLCLLKMVFHLALSNRYGYHGDELYFIECGKHLAFGYVDHAPLVPWLARLSGLLFGESLTALRIFPVLAGVLTVVLTAIAARELGGTRFAQGLAGLCALIAPAYLVMSGMLNIPVFEPTYWLLCGLLIIRIIRGGDPKLWLAVGLFAGIGLLNKHTMLLWGAGIAVGFGLTPQRRLLRSPWPWLGGILAFLIFLPNLLWQSRHEWATLEFVRNIDSGMLAEIPRLLFVLGQVLYMHPFALPVWVLGLVFFFSRPGRDFRVFGWLYLTVLTILLIRHGKPYYLAPAYPMLFAGGAVWLEGRASLIERPMFRRIIISGLAVGGIALAPFASPLLPLSTTERVVGVLFGAVIPPDALTHDFHLQFGWPELADSFAGAVADLPPEEQARTAIFTKRYASASAVNHYGAVLDLPRAYSGQMTYYFWGPPPDDTETILTCGFERALLESKFKTVDEVATITHPLAIRRYRGLPIYRCRSPRESVADSWEEFRRFYHVDKGESSGAFRPPESVRDGL
jgi:hypothetical protein